MDDSGPWNRNSGANSNANNNSDFRNAVRPRNNNPFNRNTTNEIGAAAPVSPPPFEDKPFKSVLTGGVLQGYASAREVRAKYPNANDCEIICLDKNVV